jgi:hypothetical protein
MRLIYNRVAIVVNFGGSWTQIGLLRGCESGINERRWAVAMRRWLLLAVFAPAVLIFADHPVAAAELPQQSCAGWTQLFAVEVTGSIGQGGLKGRHSFLLDPRDGRSVTVEDFGGFSEASGFDGQVGWTRDRSGGSHDLNAAAAHAISTTEGWLFRRGWCSRGDTSIETTAESREGAGALRAWQVTPRDGIPVILRFDATTGLLREAEYRLWGNRLIRHYDDWRAVERGVMVPFSERDEDPEDEDTEVITLSEVKLNAGRPPASAFARPPPPADSEIRGGAASTTVSYEDDGGARLYVPVFVNERGPYAFEIDTGGHLIVGKELAATLGLGSVGSFSSTGAGTAITQAGVAPKVEIRIGEALMRAQVAKVRSFANDRISSRPARAGLLGLELFERFAVQVDRGAKTITLTPLAKFTGGSGTALPIHFIEDAPLTAGAYDGHPGEFEIDSGNAGPTIIEGYWSHQLGLDVALSQGISWGAGSGASAYEEHLSRGDLALGPLKFPHQLVSYVGEAVRGSEATRLQAAVAGEWLLHCYDTTYDYGHGVIWVGARHDCPELPFNHSGMRLTAGVEGLTVNAVAPGTPAAAAGISRGDRIISIDGKDAFALSARDAGALLAGPVGSELEIVWIPGSGGDRKTVRLKLAEFVP